MEELIGKKYVRDKLKVSERYLKVFIPLKYCVSDMDIKGIGQAFLSNFDYYLRFAKSCPNN